MRISDYCFSVQRTMDRLSAEHPTDPAIRRVAARASRAVALLIDGKPQKALQMAEAIAATYGIDDDETQPPHRDA